MPDITKYFSQWDSDSGGFKGLCAETCLKMADTYYHDREIPLTEIVKNGDGTGAGTTEAGAIKAANWLGLKNPGYFWRDITQNDLKTWLGKGNLVMAFINYDLVPQLYKQQTTPVGVHAILLTAISDDLQSIRYADPNFWGSRREEGWMNNNKWINWSHLSPAWKAVYKPYLGLQIDLVKFVPPPVTPPTDPCAAITQQFHETNAKLVETQKQVEGLAKQLETEKKAVDELKLERDGLRETVRTLGAKITEQEKIIEDGQGVLEKLQTELDKEVQLRRQLAIDNNTLTDQLTKQGEDFEKRMGIAEDQIADYRKKVEPLTVENQELKHKVDALGNEIKDLQLNTVKAVSSQVLLLELWNRLMRRG